MDLIDKEDDLTLGFRNLVHHRFQTFLELAFIFSSGDQRAHIQREDLFRLQVLGNVTPNDTMGQPLSDSSLTYTRLTDQDRIVLRTAAQDLQDTADLLVTSDHGVQFTATGTLVQIDGVFS